MASISTDYSMIASRYDRVREMRRENIDVWVSALSEYGSIEAMSDVLEIGAGTGRFTTPLCRKTRAHITALDLSQDMLKLAKGKKLSEHVNWIRGNAESLPFPGSTFDCVFMMFTLQHIADRTQALREIYRVLRPQGRLIIGTASHGQFRREIVSKYFPDLLTIDLARFPTIPKLKWLLRKHGFNTVDSHYVNGKPVYLSKKEYLDWIRHKPLSTFALLPQTKYHEGLAAFNQAKLNGKMKEHFIYYQCVCVTAAKQGNLETIRRLSVRTPHKSLQT